MTRGRQQEKRDIYGGFVLWCSRTRVQRGAGNNGIICMDESLWDTWVMHYEEWAIVGEEQKGMVGLLVWIVRYSHITSKGSSLWYGKEIKKGFFSSLLSRSQWQLESYRILTSRIVGKLTLRSSKWIQIAVKGREGCADPIARTVPELWVS